MHFDWTIIGFWIFRIWTFSFYFWLRLSLGSQLFIWIEIFWIFLLRWTFVYDLNIVQVVIMNVNRWGVRRHLLDGWLPVGPRVWWPLNHFSRIYGCIHIWNNISRNSSRWTRILLLLCSRLRLLNRSCGHSRRLHPITKGFDLKLLNRARRRGRFSRLQTFHNEVAQITFDCWFDIIRTILRLQNYTFVCC